MPQVLRQHRSGGDRALLLEQALLPAPTDARGATAATLRKPRDCGSQQCAKAERIAAVCRRHHVPLAAIAPQFPFGHPSVIAVIPGPVATEEVRNNLAWMRRDIPDALWAELRAERLIRPDAPTPHR